MSDITRAREAAIQAETRIEHSFDVLLEQLHVMNSRLVELYEEIKAVQPVANDSVCLELYPCGAGCVGCPHPRWVQYRWRARPSGDAVLLSLNLSAKEKDPVLAVPRGKPHSKATSALIREAKSILIKRTRLIALFRSMRTTQKNFAR